MFTQRDDLPCPKLSPDAIVLLYVSLNQVNISIGSDAYPARGFLVGWKRGQAYRFMIFIYFPALRMHQIWLPEKIDVDYDTLREQEAAGVEFLETMGCMLDPVELHNLDGRTMELILSDLPFLDINDELISQPANPGSMPPPPRMRSSGSSSSASRKSPERVRVGVSGDSVGLIDRTPTPTSAPKPRPRQPPDYIPFPDPIAETEAEDPFVEDIDIELDFDDEPDPQETAKERTQRLSKLARLLASF